MLERHPRFRSIRTQTCVSDCPKGGPRLRVLLFLDDAKFRSHSVNHLADMLENAVWRQILPTVDMAAIVRSIDNLRDLGCPFFEWSSRPSRPPCRLHEHYCRLFHNCTDLIQPVEQLYLDATERVIAESLSVPRYACYTNKEDYSQLLSGIPDKRLVFILSCDESYDEPIYHVKTCFADSLSKSLSEWVHRRKQRLISEALVKSIVWCHPTYWEIHDDRANSKTGAKKKTGNERKIRKTRRVYSRVSGKNWRQYIDDWDSY